MTTTVESEVKSSLSRSSSHSTLNDLPPASYLASPQKRLYIVSNGIALVRLPLPSRELEISLFADDGYTDKVYSSLRAKRHSGSCVLSKKTEDGTWIDVATTTYRFGPGRDPKVGLLSLDKPVLSSFEVSEIGGEKQGDSNSIALTSLSVGSATTLVPPTDEITIKAVSFISRSQTFAHNGHKFTWSYARLPPDEQGNKTPGSLIELRMQPESKETLKSSASQSSASGDDKDGIVVAQLIRTEQTRTPGTGRCTAGNGGLLVMTSRVGSDIEERLVISTIISMLKKEVDRRRGLQFMMLGGVAGGGP